MHNSTNNNGKNHPKKTKPGDWTYFAIGLTMVGAMLGGSLAGFSGLIISLMRSGRWFWG